MGEELAKAKAKRAIAPGLKQEKTTPQHLSCLLAVLGAFMRYALALLRLVERHCAHLTPYPSALFKRADPTEVAEKMLARAERTTMLASASPGAEFRPRFRQLWPAHFGANKVWPKYGKNTVRLANVWPTSSSNGCTCGLRLVNVGQSCPRSGQLQPNLTTLWTDSAKFRTSGLDACRSWPKLVSPFTARVPIETWAIRARSSMEDACFRFGSGRGSRLP